MMKIPIELVIPVEPVGTCLSDPVDCNPQTLRSIAAGEFEIGRKEIRIPL